MKVTYEEIMPQQAEIYLNTMEKNRPLSNRVVTKYAGMMRKGQWLTTHQGIAFDEKGRLIDGQHRLWAIIEAGACITMMVTRGLPVSITVKGVELNTMDGIDGMRARSTSDQLSLSHNVSNPTKVHAALTVIAQIVGGAKWTGLTVPQAVGFLPIYGKDADIVITELKNFKPVRLAVVAGTLAFARQVFQDEVDTFTMRLVDGAGLKAGDPCLVLRNKLINSGMHGSASSDVGRLEGARMIANAFLQQKDGKTMQNLRPSEEGLNLLRSKQKSNVTKIRNVLGMESAK